MSIVQLKAPSGTLVETDETLAALLERYGYRRVKTTPVTAPVAQESAAATGDGQNATVAKPSGRGKK